MLCWVDSGDRGHVTTGGKLLCMCFALLLSLGSGSCFGGEGGIKVKSEFILVIVRETHCTRI